MKGNSSNYMPSSQNELLYQLGNLSLWIGCVVLATFLVYLLTVPLALILKKAGVGSVLSE